MNINLSKSTFLKGYQCPKALYLHKFFPELKTEVSKMQQAIFEKGTEVGIKARQLFPGGVNASPDLPNNFEQAVQYTSELIGQHYPVIYEAGFCYENVYCFVDILVREGDGWHAYEVKSSTSMSPIYHLDAAVQYYVMKNTGLHITSFDIILLNNKYVRNGPLDLSQLFSKNPVMHLAERLQSRVVDKLSELKALLSLDVIPQKDIGPHCFDPYSCDFISHCWKHVPEDSVFDVAGLIGQKKWELYHKGILRLVDIPDDFPLNPAQKLQVLSARTGKVTWKKDKIDLFRRNFRHPLYFLDFESFQPAIPLFENTRPYQQVPFQYSLHILEADGSVPEHREFLADPGPDPRPGFAKHLLEDIGSSGDIVVYNEAFERRILQDLARDLPEYTADIGALLSRLRDLMEPFRKKSIYMPRMKGSYSIKNVYPAMVAGNGYADLEIADGGSASLEYEGLIGQTDKLRIEKTKKDLLDYCCMDTLAMVEIWKAIS